MSINTTPRSAPSDDLGSSLSSHRRIAIITDGYSTPFLAKTAISLVRYRTKDVAAVIDTAAAGSTAQELLGVGGAIPVVNGLSAIPDVDALYIGIAPPGGKLPEEWRRVVMEALQRGIDVVSGLHDFLTSDDDYLQAAAESGSRLIDVRRNQFKSTAKGHRFRTGCARIHTVGHDCSIGKMVTSMEIHRGLVQRDLRSKFLATGQTGIMISGHGLPIDCVVADFINGAAEQLVQESEDQDFLLIEGQGSISHPSFSAVTMGLLHGSAPDGLVYCYEAGRTQVKGLDDVDIPPMKDQVAAYLMNANLRHPCKLIGIAVNTRSLSEVDAIAEIDRAEAMFGLPACDVFRMGADKLVDACIALRSEVLAR
ncbi:hypothetical protein K227x_04410 [Rubripirellula lacrimiformis]|uniref:DUF1611 domain-containing protein n=1 Tax=Rubripirellula lacrimiformis TaxID=1930273 RepID=A0A517N4K6_9BACT|nr:DUF1611 domain-containing protein [Rubripirellula lacrimiformis]QDT02070.1 hypothetical protein K227x_04410 [Rubripirellula lacrimiformis]